jgi:hypothetical protein
LLIFDLYLIDYLTLFNKKISSLLALERIFFLF